jgi:hypothetical protein
MIINISKHNTKGEIMDPNKINNNNEIKTKRTFFRKIKDMALKTKHTLKDFFPRRIKATDQEKNKGPKF